MIKQGGLYQNKVSSSLVCARKCKMDYSNITIRIGIMIRESVAFHI